MHILTTKINRKMLLIKQKFWDLPWIVLSASVDWYIESCLILRTLRTEDYQKIRSSERNLQSSQSSNILGSRTCNGRRQGCWSKEDCVALCSYTEWFRFKCRPCSRHSVDISRITVHLNIVINKVSKVHKMTGKFWQAGGLDLKPLTVKDTC